MTDELEPGVEEHARAVDHRETALRILDNDGEPAIAAVHAILALEARVEELVVYVAQAR